MLSPLLCWTWYKANSVNQLPVFCYPLLINLVTRLTVKAKTTAVWSGSLCTISYNSPFFLEKEALTEKVMINASSLYNKKSHKTDATTSNAPRLILDDDGHNQTTIQTSGSPFAGRKRIIAPNHVTQNPATVAVVKQSQS